MFFFSKKSHNAENGPHSLSLHIAESYTNTFTIPDSHLLSYYKVVGSRPNRAALYSILKIALLKTIPNYTLSQHLARAKAYLNSLTNYSLHPILLHRWRPLFRRRALYLILTHGVASTPPPHIDRRNLLPLM